MKKRLVVLLAAMLLIVFSFAGCGNKNEDGGKTNSGNNNAKTNGEKEGTKNNSSKNDEKTGKDEGQSNFEEHISVIEAKDPGNNPKVATNRKDTLVVSWDSAEGQFNPIYSSSVPDSQVNGLVFGDGMMGVNEQGLPVGELAERWEISEDGKTYTFFIRKGVKFQNGTELTTKDIEFTYLALADPGYDGARMDSVRFVKGYKEYNEGDATSLEGITVIDDHTISFELTQIVAPAIIQDFGWGVLSKDYYGFEKGNFSDIKTKFDEPMGAGPYKLVDHNPGSDATFEKFDGYWKGTPKMDKIVYKVLTAEVQVQELVAGGVDICDVQAKPKNIQQLEEAGFLNLHFYPSNGYNYIGVNQKHEILKDKLVRQAMMYGLNRKGFVTSFYKGYADVQNTPVSVVSWAYSNDVNQYPFKPEKAMELLEEAGWKVGDDGYRYKDGKKLSVGWKGSTGAGDYYNTLIKVLVDNMKDIGMEIVPEFMDFSVLVEQVYTDHNFDLYSMSWNLAIDPDPSGIFGRDQMEAGGFNSVQWDNERSFELMEKGLVETDQEKRVAIYKEWSKLANEELPYLFLRNTKSLMATNTRVQGVSFSPYKGWMSVVHEITVK